MRWILLCIALLFVAGAAAQAARQWAGDDAIRRVEDCVCYKSIDAQNLQPWELAWDAPDKLRKQISHCVCRAHIDIPNVRNPGRYLVPGTVVQ
jgi:hypothetical protein